MADFKNILLHIFSQIASLKELDKPDDDLKELFEKAQKYACGGDVKIKEQKNLQSIFDGLAGADKKGYGFEAKALSLEDFNFPTDKKIETSTNVFDKFQDEYKNIKTFQDKAFAETCLALLEKYFCYVPCGVVGLEEVSLFDYIKSVAGFMVCLQQSEDILLIGGDISGIQAFIYDIISKNASKNLKGRSFYLQLLVDNALQKILNKLGLFKTNVIYSSGGGFFLIAPNTKSVIDDLQEVSKEIDKALFDAHNTSLFLAIDYEPLKTNKLPETWKSLSHKLANQKRKRYNQKLISDYKNFFEPFEIGGSQDRDVITNEEFSHKERKIPLEDSFVKVATKRQIDLGRFLKETNYWIQSEKGNIELKGDFVKLPIFKGVTNFFVNSVSTDIKNVSITKINNLDFIGSKSNAYNFIFYGGNQFPINDTDETENGKVISRKGEIKTFDRLAGEEGFRRLGILRMDVDGLGAIFQKGFKTLAHYSVLSRKLDYFFKGYLNTIWGSKDEYKNHTYILYSGGDDLFIIGKWNYLIDFAYQIYQDFRKWTCDNDKVGLSGGIAIVPAKFPIAKGANLADEAEKLAKNHTYNGKEKNAFALMGIPLNWQHEFPLVFHLKNELVKLIEGNEKLPKGFLQRITGFYEQAKIQKAKGQNEAWKWRIAYDFSQVRKSLKDEQTEAKAFLDKIKEAVFTDKLFYLEQQYHKDKYNFLELLNLAARWTELEIRTK